MVLSGLPDVTIQDWLPLKFGEEQALAAVTILLVGFMESLSITKLLAEKYDYHIGVEQEVVSLGLCNLIGAMFSGYVGVGSFSRSAVVASLGSHTPIHGLVTGMHQSKF
jgi:MFS superfamily sulfate permease-like transporter